METKNKQNEKDKQAKETWRKPLQVPPRSNAMRSFYQGGEEVPNENINRKNLSVTPPKENQSSKIEQKQSVQSSPEKEEREEVKVETNREATTPQNYKSVSESNNEQSGKLTEAELSRQLGIEVDDLFDIHELLRGKSFEIYQNLLHSRDDKGRCKITQPELMNRTGIKNRRTFYKHEERLINLKLIEKRHQPGDHKGIVYRVFEMGEVLPVSAEMLEQFVERLKENA